MTVSTFAKDGPYVGDGGTTNGGHQQFTIDFEFFDSSEIVATTRVTATGTEATLASNAYTITGTGSSPYTGGTLTLVDSLAATSTLTISRSVAQTQTTDLVSGDTLPAETLEDRVDRMTLMIQDLQEQVNRCPKVAITDGATVEAACNLPDSKARASCYLTFDINGLPSATGTAITGITASAFAATLLDDANGSDAQSTLGITDAAKSILDDTSVAAIRTTLGVPASVTILDQDDMDDDDATKAPSQQSVKAFVVSRTVTMAAKTLTSPVLTTPTFSGNVATTIPMGSHKITGLAAGTASGDALHAGQVDGTSIHLNGSNQLETITSGQAIWNNSGTVVFNSTHVGAANTFEDLDLSGVVGTNRALVFLEVWSEGNLQIAVRPNGYGASGGNDAKHFTYYRSGGGCVYFGATGQYTYFTTVTDSVGKIEIMASANNVDFTITVVGYIK